MEKPVEGHEKAVEGHGKDSGMPRKGSGKAVKAQGVLHLARPGGPAAGDLPHLGGGSQGKALSQPRRQWNHKTETVPQPRRQWKRMSKAVS